MLEQECTPVQYLYRLDRETGTVQQIKVLIDGIDVYHLDIER